MTRDALGGEATVDNIELRCRRHNDYEGRLYFGKRRRDDNEPGNLFRNKLSGGAPSSTRSASVEGQR